jgi:hypothetical protein
MGSREGIEENCVKELAAGQSNLTRRGHGVEDAGDDLSRASAAHVVGGLGFEQLGVGENNPELVIQTVKEKAEI